MTLYRVFTGFFLGIMPAIAVGLLMAMFRPVRIFFDPLIASLFPIPKIALMPLLLLAFGFGDASKIALVVIAVFFPVVVNTYVGAANIEKIYWDVAKNYGASQSVIFRRIVFFGALPMIFAGLRIALAVSFIVLVAAEFVATKAGIGYLIWNSWELLQVDVMFVGIVTVGMLGLIATVMPAGDRAQGHSLEGGVGACVGRGILAGDSRVARASPASCLGAPAGCAHAPACGVSAGRCATSSASSPSSTPAGRASRSARSRCGTACPSC